MSENNKGWSLILAQTHLSLKDATAFKMFIMNYWSETHSERNIDFLEITHDKALLEGLVKLFKKQKK